MDEQRTESVPPERGERVPKDRLLELLSVERRRHVVAHLWEATVPVAVADLARRVAELEAKHSQAATDDEDAVHFSLHHRHVPKLVDADVVTLDPDRNTVEPGAEFERAAALLDALAGLGEE